MSTGIPYGGAAQRWHDNPLQEEVDRLRLEVMRLRRLKDAAEDVLFWFENLTEVGHNGNGQAVYKALRDALKED
jgi:hypothetical protein